MQFNNSTLEETDQFISQLIEQEDRRQQEKLIMIASESICPQAIIQALSSSLCNIYAEGYPSRFTADPELTRGDGVMPGYLLQ